MWAMSLWAPWAFRVHIPVPTRHFGAYHASGLDQHYFMSPRGTTHVFTTSIAVQGACNNLLHVPGIRSCGSFHFNLVSLVKATTCSLTLSRGQQVAVLQGVPTAVSHVR